MKNELRIRKGDDGHLHLRDAEDERHEQDLLAEVVHHSARAVCRGLVMPNTKKPIESPVDIVRYREGIIQAAGIGFEPLMVVKLTQATRPEQVFACKRAGAIAYKLYPQGATHNSHGGVTDVRALREVYAALEEAGLVLCVHGETPGAFCLNRTDHFLEHLDWLAKMFPRLRIVWEHLDTKTAVDKVASLGPHVAGSITSHHMLTTLDDIVGPPLRPHNYCLPLPKYPHDRKAITQAAMSGNPKFFWGTDSAPHIQRRKECAEGCAGAFTAPVALPILVTLFEDAGCLHRLEPFTSRFFADFYQLALNQEELVLQRHAWTVPCIYGRVVPFLAGERLEWQIAT